MIHTYTLKGLINRDPKISKFISQIYHHFCINTTEVIINMATFGYETHKSSQGSHNIYGYRKFKELFCLNNDDGFNMHSLIYLFVNLQSFVIYCRRSGNYAKSISLNSAFIDDLYKTINIVNNSRSLKRSLKELIIVKPSAKTPINIFIDRETNNLAKLGWNAIKKTFNDGRRGRNCDDSMYIYPSL